MVKVALVFGVIAFFEVPGLIRSRLWRELAVFSFFWLAGLVLAGILAAGGAIPNPNRAVEAVVDAATHLLKRR